MRNGKADSGSAATYEIEPKSKYFEAIRAIAEYEIRPGNTVIFLSEVDLTEVERVRACADGGHRPSYTAFVVKAVALALRDFPYANRRVCRRPWLPFSGPRLQKFHHSDVAVACERDIPGAESIAFLDILRDADRLSLMEITEALHELAVCDPSTNKQWREFSTLVARLPSWLSTLLIRLPCLLPSLWTKYRGGAVLVSSPAKYGVDVVAGTWTHPLGVSFGIARRRPVVRGESVVACPTFTLTLSFDRRVMAGAQAARMFRKIVERLEKAESEMVVETEGPMASPEILASAAPRSRMLDKTSSVKSADPESCSS
jgi:pyruvate/2-oxoglutarate dehydrogenase complex dihydrolipoamide acyltransferase (E2) component